MATVERYTTTDPVNIRKITMNPVISSVSPSQDLNMRLKKYYSWCDHNVSDAASTGK
jgi:hypothetical protein